MSFDQVTNEPKKVFLNILIGKTWDIETEIYCSGSKQKAITKMMGLIDSLSEESKKSLKELRGHLVNDGHSPESIMKCFQDLTTYLNKTYFQEIHIGIVPSVSLPSNRKPPENKPIPPELSPHL